MAGETTTWTTICADTQATLELGGRLARALVALQVTQFVIDLRGELGAGKTVFVRGVARGLGVPPTQRVVSPTFTIARAYVTPAGALSVLHHVDAYRLAGVVDLEAAGFEEMCGPGRLTCVEWAEIVEEALPVDRLRVILTPLRDPVAGAALALEGPRRLDLAATGVRSLAVLRALRTSSGDLDQEGA